MSELYPNETLQLQRAEYEYIIAACKKINAKSALEFGPGSTTLALIEAGLERIVTCEHIDKWYEAAKERFKDYKQVQVVRFRNEAPIARVDELLGQFDIGLVDAPSGYTGRHPDKVLFERLKGQEDCSRLNTCLKALKHCPVVLLHDAQRPLERATLGRLNKLGHRTQIVQSSRGCAIARIKRAE